jgi:hypothetical protein
MLNFTKYRSVSLAGGFKIRNRSQKFFHKKPKMSK